MERFIRKRSQLIETYEKNIRNISDDLIITQLPEI